MHGSQRTEGGWFEDLKAHMSERLLVVIAGLRANGSLPGDTFSAHPDWPHPQPCAPWNLGLSEVSCPGVPT